MGTTLNPDEAPMRDNVKPQVGQQAKPQAKHHVSRLAWVLRWHLGWAGNAGLALLLLSLLLALGLAWPRSMALQQLQRDVAAMHKAMPQHQGQWIDRSPQASLNTFYQFLPAEQEANALLSQLLQLAEHHGLAPEKVDYSLQRETAAHFSRYQLNIPLRGSYRDIRRFMAAALNSTPALALNEINFKRLEDDLNAGPGQAQAEVEAKLRLTLYLDSGQKAGLNNNLQAGAQPTSQPTSQTSAKAERP